MFLVNYLSKSFLFFLLKVSWQLAALGLVVYLAIKVFRIKGAAVRYFLWLSVPAGVVLCQPLVTLIDHFGPESLRNPLLRGPGLEMVSSEYPATSTYSKVTTEPPLEENIPRQVPPRTINLPKPKQIYLPPRKFIPPLLFLLWFGGAAFMLIRLILGQKYLSRLRRASQPLTDASLFQLLRRVLEGIGIRKKVSLLTSSLASAPFVTGILHPAIILPRDMTDSFPPRDMKTIFAHEAAHLKRHDYLVNLFQRLMEVLLFFHPFIWFVNRRIRIEREHVCDDVVIRLTRQPGSYARCLTMLVEQTLHKPATIPVSLGIMHYRSRIGRRLESILDTRRRIVTRLSLRTLIASSLIGILMVVIVAGSSVARKETTPKKATSSGKGKEALASKVKVGEENAVKGEVQNGKTASINSLHLILEMDYSPLAAADISPDSKVMDKTLKVIRARLAQISYGDFSLTKEGQRLIIDVKTLWAPERVANLLIAKGTLELKLVRDNRAELQSALKGIVPEGYQLVYREDKGRREPLLLRTEPLLRPTIREAKVVFWKEGSVSVQVILAQKDAEEFARITEENINKRIAIVVDGKVISTPKIRVKIVGSRFQIMGNFSLPEARDFATILGNGPLPLPLKLIKVETKNIPRENIIPNVKWLYKEGNFLYREGKYAEAIRKFEYLIKSYPASPESIKAYSQMAQSHEKQGEWKKAIKAYRTLIDIHPSNEEAIQARLKIGRLYSAHDEYEKAIETYLSFTKDYPESPQILWAESELGRCYLYLGEYEKAISQFREVVKKGKSSQSIPRLGFWAQNLALNAQSYINLIRNNSDYDNKPLGLYFTALRQMRQRQYVKAMDTYRQLISTYPDSKIVDNVKVHLIMTEVLPLRRTEIKGRPDLSPAIERLKELASHYPEGDAIPWIYSALADFYEKQGDSQTAKKYYKLLINQFPDNPFAKLAERGMENLGKKTGRRWISIGPRIGIVSDIAMGINEKKVLYAAGGELFKSINEGKDWTGHRVARESPLAIAVVSDSPNIIYAGTSKKLFKSVDGGKSWQDGGLEAYIKKIVIHPTDPNRVYIATDQKGIFKTENGGRNWIQIGLKGKRVFDIAISPANPKLLFATIWGKKNFLKSLDGGLTWSTVKDASGLISATKVSFSPSNPNIVYATGGKIFYRSEDSGKTWNRLPVPKGLLISSIAVVPDNPDTVYIGGGDVYPAAPERGVFKTEDGGKSWTKRNRGLTVKWITCFLIDPTNSQIVYVGTRGGGIFKSIDGGANWKNTGWVGGYAHQLLIDSKDRNTLYASFQYQGGIYKTRDRGRSWQYLGFAPAAYPMCQSKGKHPVLYVAGIGVNRSNDGGLTWTQTLPNKPVRLLAIAPNRDQILYAVGKEDFWAKEKVLFRTEDGGETWETVVGTLPDMNRMEQLAVSPENPNTIFIASYKGLFVSKDGGKRWQNTIPHVAIFSLAFTSDYIFAGSHGKIYRSKDNGSDWKELTKGLKEASIVYLLPHPGYPGTLYAAERFRMGVLMSNDWGETWKSISQSLPVKRIWSLAIGGRKGSWILYAGSWGKGVFAYVNPPLAATKKPGKPTNN